MTVAYRFLRGDPGYKTYLTGEEGEMPEGGHYRFWVEIHDRYQFGPGEFDRVLVKAGGEILQERRPEDDETTAQAVWEHVVRETMSAKNFALMEIKKEIEEE